MVPGSENSKTAAGALDERPVGKISEASFWSSIVSGRYLIPVLSAVVVLGILIAFAVHSSQEAEKTGVGSGKTENAGEIAGESVNVLTVSTAPAIEKLIQRHLAVNGSVSAWDPLAIGAEVSSLRVASVNVEEGDRVKKGQVLATLNSSILKAQLAQQKAHLAADQAALKKAIQPNRVEDVNSWRAALSQAEANLAQEEANLIRVKANAANMKVNAERYLELRKVGAVSQMDADSRATEAKTSAADVAASQKRVEAMQHALNQAKERLAMAEKGGRQEDIEISKANLEETRARVSQLEAQIEQTIIRAPADGKIVKREVHLGEITSVGKTLFLMVRDGRFELRAQVPEVDLPRIKSGMPVKMTATAEGEALMGFVREVSPSVDEKTRLGVARIDLPENAKSMKPGLFYHAEIDLGKENALVVPSRAVLSRNEKDVLFVYDLSTGKALLRPITVGEPLRDGLIEIKNGLAAGEEVIVTGAGFMKDGDKVRAVKEVSASRK